MESEETILMESAGSDITDFSSVGKEEDGSSSCDATVGTEEEDEERARTAEMPDRCSDGSDSGLGLEDEGRSNTEPGASTSGITTLLPRSPLPLTATPTRSTLKRRLSDQTQDEVPLSKKKRSINWDSVTVFYFPRAQGFTCVPSQGGSTLGMASQHSHIQNFTLAEHALEQRRHHRQMLLQLRSQRLQEAAETSVVTGNQITSSSSEDSESDDETSELSDNEVDPDNYYCLQPVPTRQRRVMLRTAGVRKIDSVEKDECRDIRSSREFCGCACKGYCDPDTCSCARAGIKCQVDRLSFPCGCTRDGCANGAGRIEFNLERVRTHFIQTLMRLEMETKQNVEQERQKQLAQWGNTGELPSASGLLAKQLEPKPGPHHVSLSPNMESCVHAGNFSTHHYDQQQQSVNRGEALDLFSFREEESFSPQEQNKNQENEKLVIQQQQYSNFSFTHPTGFTSQTQNFAQHHSLEFDSAYRFHEHNGYQHQNHHPHHHHSIFTSSFSATNFGALQYDYQNFVGGVHKNETMVNGLSEVEFCDPSQVITYPDNQLLFTHNEEDVKEESSNSSSSKYTSLHPVSGNNTKLEPFSELLGAQYVTSSSSSPSSFAPAMFHPTASFAGCDTNTVQSPQLVHEHEPRQLTNTHEECAENFGEIIKKSMVETVSA